MCRSSTRNWVWNGDKEDGSASSIGRIGLVFRSRVFDSQGLHVLFGWVVLSLFCVGYAGVIGSWSPIFVLGSVGWFAVFG
jgi:hypothetical protein